MNDEQKNTSQNEDPQGNGGPMKNYAAMFLVFALVLTVFTVVSSQSNQVKELAYSPDFVNMVKEGKVASCTVMSESRGRTHLNIESTEKDTETGQALMYKVNVIYTDEIDQFLKDNISALTFKKANPYIEDILFSTIPFILILALIYFLVIRQMRSAGKGAMSFGKSRAKMLTKNKNKVTFNDVAGVEEAKDEVGEIVDFLKDPQKFRDLGGRIPKGVLLVGPPGTGKTLLAKAIAGEAEVPFFSISGSDFVEMFVGVGASRVRDMFEQGRKNAPCIIFIDEIDAVGRSRFSGIGGGHDEREQTLNALLVEMDGFDTQEGIIIIAATNRPDVLDSALLRPGRFDRQITIDLPPLEGREKILGIHTQKIKLDPGVSMRQIARGTPGFSGAELANLVNEAALIAARKNKKEVHLEDLEEARDKVRWGRERRSLALSDKDKENTAYHEAGHAILNELLEHTDPVHKVTIIPRGPSLGSTMFLPEEDKYSLRKNELLDDLVVSMGGRVAEEIVFGDVTNGAMGDIRMATNIARKMVCEWGMSDTLGMMEYGESQGEMFLARDIGRSKNYSEETALLIDQEIKKLIDHAYTKAKDMLTHHREQLDTMAKILLEQESIDGQEVKEIVHHNRILPPDERNRLYPDWAEERRKEEEEREKAREEASKVIREDTGSQEGDSGMSPAPSPA